MAHAVAVVLKRLRELADVPSVEGRVKGIANFPFEGGPGIGVRLEDWQPLTEASGINVRAEIDVGFYINATAVDPDDLDETILKVDAELHAALMADHTLGLPFVENVERSNFPTDANAEGSVPTGSAISRWRIQFHYNRTDINVEV